MLKVKKKKSLKSVIVDCRKIVEVTGNLLASVCVEG
jgi:hypothetical protein